MSGRPQGPYTVKIAQPGQAQPELQRVDARDQLVGALGGGVQADRLIDRIVDRERLLLVAPVDAGGRGVHEVLDAAVLARGLEQVDEADQVAVDVRARIFERVTHAGLRGQVDDAARPVAGEQRVQCGRVRQIGLHLGEALAGAQAHHPVALELRIVVVVEIVEPDHGLAAGEQRGAHRLPDEPGAAGHKDHICQPV
jgi:hypothetical protein